MVLAGLVLVKLLATNPTGILFVHSEEIEESQQALLKPANWPKLEEKCKELNCSLTMEGNVAVVWPKGLYGLDEAPKFRQGLKKLLDEIDPTKVVDMQAISNESKEFVKSFLKRSDYPQYRRSMPESFPFILESSVGVSLRVGNRALDSINTMSNSPRFDDAFYAFEPKVDSSPRWLKNERSSASLDTSLYIRGPAVSPSKTTRSDSDCFNQTCQDGS